MSYFDQLDYETFIGDLETTLLLSETDYGLNYDGILANVKARIKTQYCIDLNVTSLDEALSIDTNSELILALYHRILDRFCTLAGAAAHLRFVRKVPINLQSVSYFGYKREDLLKGLQVLTFPETVNNAGALCVQLKEIIPLIKLTIEKRTLVCLLLAYDLKLYDLSSLIAEIMFSACIV